jgi:hypothetical protein
MFKLQKYSQPNKLCVPSSHGYYYLVKDVEPILNSVQQLKAEIAALADEHSNNAKICGGNYFNLVRKLRQLSAV